MNTGDDRKKTLLAFKTESGLMKNRARERWDEGNRSAKVPYSSTGEPTGDKEEYHKRADLDGRSLWPRARGGKR